ncbi:MAG TPA: discoidin domain-containing protein, partial [Actinopolymorphaceae bacterium]
MAVSPARSRRSAWVRSVTGGTAVCVATVLATVTGTDAAPASPLHTASGSVTTITLDGRDSGRVFDGVGGVSAGGSSRLLVDYPEPERSQILDYLFEPNYGAALDILKVEIGGDVDSTSGAEASHQREPDEIDCTRGYEWWLMAEARKRNPDIAFYGLPWGAPGWFDDYWSPDRADYLVSWLDCARENGFEIDYLGAANESGWNRDFSVHLRSTLDQNGYENVRIVATDNHAPPDYWFVAPEMLSDPELSDAVDVLGEHDVCVWRTEQRECHVRDEALQLGKPLWDSENSTQQYDIGAHPLARAMNRHYIDAEITGNLNWALISAWYDTYPIGGTGLMLAERPWSGDFEVGPSIWVDAHTTQFTDPGWRYLDDAAGYSPAGASHVALRSPDRDDYTVVIETLDSTATETLRFDIEGGLPTGPVQVWTSDLRTSGTDDDFLHTATVEPVDGSFEITVEPGHLYTLSTTTGQAKGDARPSADPGEQLVMPYRENFEQVTVGRRARYFADVHGAFEAARCAGGRKGTCYRQVVTRQPLSWHAVDMPPTTLMGDPRWWGDYEVSTDVLLEDEGFVELLGRVDSQQHNAAGYHLRIAHDGTWSLFSQDVRGQDSVLASGEVSAIGTGTWHRPALRFRGERITALLDGEVLATVDDAGHTTGQVGFRVSGWDRAQFDDLSIVPTGPRPRLVPHSRMAVTATSEHTGNDAGTTYDKERAIDDRLWSVWRSEYSPLAPLPQALTLDLGETVPVHGVVYRPPVTAMAGRITAYTVSTSTDGSSFREVATGHWADTGATKTAPLPRPVRARYVRLETTDVAGCPRAAAVAELDVSTTPLVALGRGEPADDPLPEFPALVPQEQITATATSQQAGYEAERDVDGNCGTMWHQSWSPYEAPPQDITLDLGD